MSKMLFTCRAAAVAVFLLPGIALSNPQAGAKDPPRSDRATPLDSEKDKAAARLSEAEVRLLADLHATNQMEIEMGTLARAKAKAPAVKKFGQTLKVDHQKADAEVLALAKERGVTLPDKMVPQDEVERSQAVKDMATMERLKTIEGDTFERELIGAMIDGHVRAIAKVKTASNSVADAKLKALLLRLQPSLQKHLDEAKSIQTSQEASSRN
jgi:putative membrane protein